MNPLTYHNLHDWSGKDDDIIDTWYEEMTKGWEEFKKRIGKE